MLASIHPLGERTRNSRWGITVTAYIIGSVAGGMFTGAALGWLGRLTLPPLTTATVAVAMILVGIIGASIDLLRLPLPTWHRQVNEDWLSTYRGWVYGSGFGFQLGMGLVTIVTSASIYATFLIAFLSASWTTGALIGAVFGLSRALVILQVARVDRPEDLRRFHRSMQRQAPWAQRAAVVAQVSLALAGVIVWL
jgi:MFS family permease